MNKILLTDQNKILVTGAAGFIGSHLVERLVTVGVSARAFVHYNSQNRWGNLEFLPAEILNNIEIFMGDIQDPFSVQKAVDGCDIVFHLASLIAIPYSYIAPQSYITTNVLGIVNVMEACKKSGVRKVVHTSTSECYGTAQYVPIDEKHPLQGQSPYSASKIGADMIAESYYRSFGVPVAIIRPFNTYGPRQSARAVIPTIITQILNGKAVRLGNMNPTRDLNYVTDTVTGFIKIAESPKSIGQVINIGSGQEISIENLAGKIMHLMAKQVEIIGEKKRSRPEKSEVERLLCDNSKAKKLIDWHPKISLNDGLFKTIEWIKQNMGNYKPEIYNV
jgi:NAD dependent epimerase/dehydratase